MIPQTFDGIVSTLVHRIRRSSAGGFVPRQTTQESSQSSASVQRPRVAARVDVSNRQAARAARHADVRVLSNAHDLYDCVPTTWGLDGGYVPPTPWTPTSSPTVPEAQVRTFRVFD